MKICQAISEIFNFKVDPNFSDMLCFAFIQDGVLIIPRMLCKIRQVEQNFQTLYSPFSTLKCFHLCKLFQDYDLKIKVRQKYFQIMC